MAQKINFFTEDISFQLKAKGKLRTWIQGTIESEGYRLKEVNFIFCSDDYLHRINVDYLQHDTLTDIITFDNSNVEDVIQGDIFTSIDRVRENAEQLRVLFDDELHRVLIHGILHLCGYGDKAGAEKKKMTQKENDYLEKR